MKTLNINVSYSEVLKNGNFSLVQYEVNVGEIVAVFSPHWEELNKVVTFYDAKGEKDISVPMTKENGVYRAIIPPEATRYGGNALFVIDGYRIKTNENGEEILDFVIRTKPIFIKIIEAPRRGESESERISPTDYERLVELITEISGKIDEGGQDAIDQAIEKLIDGAPEGLNTLGEISRALENNPDFALIIKESIEGISSKAEDASDKADEALESYDILNGKIGEVESIAKGRASGYVFDTFLDMDEWLKNPDNISSLSLGDNLYIRDTGVPDYWWDGKEAQILETQKVDLTEYVKKTNAATNNSYGVVLVDSEMSDTSENPVQNKVIKKYIDNNMSSGGGGEISGDYYAKVNGVEITPDGDIRVQYPEINDYISIKEQYLNIKPHFYDDSYNEAYTIWFEKPNDTRYSGILRVTDNDYPVTVVTSSIFKGGDSASVVFSTGAVVPMLSYAGVTSALTWAGDDCDDEGHFRPQPNKTYELVGKMLNDTLFSIRVGSVITNPEEA